MTEPLFFDTDCLSAFLWVDNESILAKLYPERIVVPKQVYDELSHKGLNHIKGLKSQVDAMVKSGEARIETIVVGTETYNLYSKMTTSPDSGHMIIGKGEAAALAMAKESDGIIASNNLRDITDYVSEYNLKHVTTGDIMKEALEAGYIDEAQGNKIWNDMLLRKRKLGYPSFTEYLKANKA